LGAIVGLGLGPTLGSGRLSAAPPQDPLPDGFDPDAAQLFGPGSGPELQIDLPQLEYAGDWNPRPGAMRELGQELRLRTRLAPLREPSTVGLSDDALFATPFLYISGLGGLPPLTTISADGSSQSSDQAENRLRRFIDLGGMIVFDDADGGMDLGFRRDVDALIHRISPGSELGRISPDHVLFRSFYIIDAPAGRTRAKDHLLGIQDEGRIKVLFIPNDLGGAMARGVDGRYRWSCTPGGAVQREWALRLGVNILLYATCTDYKSDRAHVETLLRNRRWR